MGSEENVTRSAHCDSIDLFLRGKKIIPGVLKICKKPALKKMKQTIKKIDQSASRITGNNTGLTKNIAGEISKFVKSVKSDANVCSGDGSKMSKKGYVSLENKIPNKTVKTLRKKLQKSIDKGECTHVIEYEGKSYSEQVASMKGNKNERYDFSKVDEVKGIVTQEVKNKIKSYYNSYFEPDFVKIYRNHHVPKNIAARLPSVFSDDWHCDGRRTDYIKLFVALSEITEDDGPFHIIDKQETKTLFRRGFDRSDPEWQRKVWEQASVTKMTGPPGTAMIANTNTSLHRAGHPEKGRVRDIALVQFAPSSEPLPEDWPSKTEYRRAGKSIF